MNLQNNHGTKHGTKHGTDGTWYMVQVHPI